MVGLGGRAFLAEGMARANAMLDVLIGLAVALRPTVTKRNQ